MLHNQVCGKHSLETVLSLSGWQSQSISHRRQINKIMPMKVPTKSEMCLCVCVCVPVYEATKKQTWQHSGWHWLGLRVITVTVECNFHIFPETFSFLKEIYFPWNELSHKYLIKVCTSFCDQRKKSGCVYPFWPSSRRPASLNASVRLPSVGCRFFIELGRLPAAPFYLRTLE